MIYFLQGLCERFVISTNLYVELPAADSFVQLLQFRLVTETDLSTNVGVEKVDL